MAGASSIPSNVPEATLERLKAFVASEFAIQEAYVDMGVPTFVIAPGPTKVSFKRLALTMKRNGYLPFLRRVDGKLIIRVIPKPKSRPSRIILNYILFAVTIVTVFVAAFLQYNHPIFLQYLMPNANLYVLCAVFTISILTIVGLHEISHKITCDMEGIEATMPYFIPGTPPLGTFGAVIMQREPPINRDGLFDLGSSGPIGGFLVTLVITIIGLKSSFIVPVAQVKQWMKMYPGEIGYINPPILFQIVIQTLLSVPENYRLFLSPIAFTAWVGSLITFLNLLPVWQLDGGWVALAVAGSKWHRVLSWLGLTIMIFMGFWPMALFILFAMWKTRVTGPLDDVSPLSLSRKIIALFLMFILVLCAVYLPTF